MHNNILTIHLAIEEAARLDVKYKKEMRKSGGMFLSEIENASDEELYHFLKVRQIIVNPKDIQEAFSKYNSAFDLLEFLKSDLEISMKNVWDESICHLSLIFIWQRKNKKEHPPLELFDYHLYKGYAFSHKEETDKALGQWYEAYKLMFYFINRLRINSIDVLKNQLEGDYELNLWMEDYLTLLNLEHTKISFYLEQHRVVCERFLAIFSKEKKDIVFLVKMNYAQSFFSIGEEIEGDRLYEQWLAENPTWRTGWVSWADNYWVNHQEKERMEKAVGILEKALKRISSLDAKEVLVRLKPLYEQLGKVEDALRIAVELKKVFDNEKEQEKIDQKADEEILTSLLNRHKFSHLNPSQLQGLDADTLS